MEHKGDKDANFKESLETGEQRKDRDYPNHIPVKISKGTEKSPGNIKGLDSTI